MPPLGGVATSKIFGRVTRKPQRRSFPVPTISYGRTSRAWASAPRMPDEVQKV